ncbi:hypothetical protein FIBSPDRAFT_871223, partial [Athelia psychrophila]
DTPVGVQTIVGPGAQGRRYNNYQGGSNWTGNEHREAPCSNRGALGTMPADTNMPLGRASTTSAKRPSSPSRTPPCAPLPLRREHREERGRGCS